MFPAALFVLLTVPPEAAPDLGRVDHLIYAAPDLDAGVREIEARLGVRAAPGGRHPGRGTRNALLSLGPAVYLEIIAPDPDQPPPDAPRAFGLDELSTPRLVTWAAKGNDLERLRAQAEGAGVALGPVESGSRRRPDGVLLTWRYTSPATVLAHGLVPFFIDWGDSPHPAIGAPGGARLVALRAEDPDPKEVRRILAGVGLALPVSEGSAPALVAVVECPRGRVELR